MESQVALTRQQKVAVHNCLAGLYALGNTSGCAGTIASYTIEAASDRAVVLDWHVRMEHPEWALSVRGQGHFTARGAFTGEARHRGFRPPHCRTSKSLAEVFASAPAWLTPRGSLRWAAEERLADAYAYVDDIVDDRIRLDQLIADAAEGFPIALVSDGRHRALFLTHATEQEAHYGARVRRGVYVDVLRVIR